MNQPILQRSHDADRTDLILRAILRESLGLDPALVAGFEDHSELFGALPEFDSMAVATVLTEMEDKFDILIEDDEVEGEIFENYGNLLAFARSKMTP